MNLFLERSRAKAQRTGETRFAPERVFNPVPDWLPYITHAVLLGQTTPFSIIIIINFFF